MNAIKMLKSMITADTGIIRMYSSMHNIEYLYTYYVAQTFL